MKSFQELIVEEDIKKSDPYRLVVLAERPKKQSKKSTSGKIVSVAEKMGMDVYNVRINGAYLERDEDSGEITIHNADDEKGFEIDADTLVMIRGAVNTKDSYLDLISQIERYGIATCNPRECIEVCSDKFRTYLRLQEIGLNQPRTVLIPNDEPETVDRAHEALDNNFPMILKTLQGSKGVGVLLIETERSLQSQVSLIYKIDPYCDILLQEYIESDYDVRVVIVNREIVGAMRRNKITDDFRSNVSQGSEPKKIKLTELEIEESLKAAKAVGGLWTAVDFIPAKNREKEPPFVIEVNSSPGTEGIEEATGQNISKEIIEFFADNKNWVKVPSECGYKEVVTIKPFGQIVAKFDTGNSGMPVIHADEMKVSGKKVTWSLLDKTITSDIIRVEEISVGGLRDYDEDRYVVKLDVEFLGTVYETEFTLDDRDERSHILFDREFMNRLNVMVNPGSKYVVTTKYSL